MCFALSLFIPQFLKWTLQALNLDLSTDANRVPVKNQKQNGSVGPDEMARYSRLIWIYTVCTGVGFGLQGWKGYSKISA